MTVNWWDFATCVQIFPLDCHMRQLPWHRWAWQLYQSDGRPTFDNGYALSYKRARRAAYRAWKATL